MATITLNNISRKEGLQLLKNVQNSKCRGLAIQGRKYYETIGDDTVRASISLITHENDRDLDQDEIDYKKCNFSIFSNYWVESTLKEFAGIE